MISIIDYLKTNKKYIDRKKEYSSKKETESHKYKIVGCGDRAFKILWFGKIPGSTKPGWNDAFWNYKNLNDISKDVINQVYNDVRTKGGQSTL